MNANIGNIQALKQYGQVGAQTGIVNASPHRLIQMLLEGALGKIAQAKGHIERKEIKQKGEAIGMAILIVEGLRDSLDLSQGEIAENLDKLYEYMNARLLEANVKSDATILDEIHGLLLDIKMAWDAIQEQPKQDISDNVPQHASSFVA